MTIQDIKQEFYDSNEWMNNISMTDAYIEYLEKKIIEMDKEIIREI